MIPPAVMLSTMRTINDNYNHGQCGRANFIFPPWSLIAGSTQLPGRGKGTGPDGRRARYRSETGGAGPEGRQVGLRPAGTQIPAPHRQARVTLYGRRLGA